MLALLVDTFLCTRIELKVCCSFQLLQKKGERVSVNFFVSFQGRAAPNASRSLQEFGQGRLTKKGVLLQDASFSRLCVFLEEKRSVLQAARVLGSSLTFPDLRIERCLRVKIPSCSGTQCRGTG